MTILFANPPWWIAVPDPKRPGFGNLRRGVRAGSRWPFTTPAQFHPDLFKWGQYLPFPFFMASAAAWVQREFLPSATVVLRDSIARGESYDSFWLFIRQLHPDYVIIETGAAALNHDLDICRDMRRLLPQVKIALAGPVAGTAHQDKPDAPVDAFLQGEYEKPAAAFIRGAVGLLAYDLLTREEMETLPFPEMDDSAALHYWDACPTGQQPPQLQLLTSRGCPYKCSFCAWPATMTGYDPTGDRQRAVRFHPAAWVKSYIQEMLARYPFRTIYFDDDTFNLNDAHVLEICEVMREIGLPWFAMCRADTSKPETLRMMKESGCKGVKIGCESGSQRVVTEIVNKRLNLFHVEHEDLPLLRDLGLSVHTTWTTGLPGETHAEAQETLTMIARLYEKGLHSTHQLSGTAEIAGTPLHTLRTCGHALKHYPGAKLSPEYRAQADGELKAENFRSNQ